MKTTSTLGLLALAATLGLSACTSGPAPLSTEPVIPDDGCTAVVVATSSEKVNLMDELGQAFKESPQAQALPKCASIYPINVSSGKASNALSSNPKEWPLSSDRSTWPTVWSPASTMWTDRVASLGGPVRAEDAVSFTHTPVVLAMPETMAKALGWPGKPISLNDVEKLVADPLGWGAVGKPLWGSFKLSKTNPNTSSTGIEMLLMQSYAAANKTSGLTTDDITGAEAFSRSFESGAIHYGDTTGKVLQNLYDSQVSGGSSYVSAIALEETSLYNYNIGNPDSHTIQPGEQLIPPSEKLVAVYPSGGSLFSDNPAVVLSSQWVSEEQKAAGVAFLEFLQTNSAQQILPQYGFRALDKTVDVSSYLNETVGIDSTQPTTTLEKPSPQVMSAALDQWAQIRKPSAVLELIDISGSMAEDAGDGRSKLQLAIQSAQGTLSNFRPTDEIGVWAFTTGITGEIDAKLVDSVIAVRPFGPLNDEKEQLVTSIGDLQNATKGGTPLYDAILISYNYMKAHADQGRINAIVVLSDGQDTDSKATIDTVIQKIHADNSESGNDKPVKIFAIAYGSGADIDELQRLAKASGGQVFDASDATKIDEVFQSVMNNF